MRISDSRYHHEKSSLDLAMRFLQHEARTKTIRLWTGLSDDRIRKLYRQYLARSDRYLPRHRGKSPNQIGYFSRSLRIQQETAVLASLMVMMGVIPPQPRTDAQPLAPGLELGGLLCEAFELYRRMVRGAQISFEHTVFLANALTVGAQLRLAECAQCGGLLVSERFPVRERRCQHCVGAPRVGGVR